MKKLLSLLLIICLAMLCGCGNNQEEASSKSETSKASEASSKANGLLSSIAEEPVSEIKSSASKLEYVDSEAESNVSSLSEPLESETTQSDSGIIEPSSIPNPCGITSKGLSSNSGKDWKMTLINPWNTLHKDYSVDLAYIDSKYSYGLMFDSRAVEYLNDMCAAAAKDGVSLMVISAYRSIDYQQGLFEAEIAEQGLAYPNASRAELEIKASTEVARPGTSEHNLGLAVDFNSVDQSFETTEQYKWLQKNCAEYGFIMRYAADKQDYTGVIYEPWHYRYVGKENAKKIQASGLSLEEYIAAQ